MAFCEKCGAVLPEGTRFCQSCGQPVAAAETPNTGYTAPQQPVQPTQNTAAPDYQRFQQQYNDQQQGGYQQPNYGQGGYQQNGYQQGGYGQGYQPPYGGGYQPPVPPSGVTVGNIYSKCFKLIAGKPILLIGLSLMGLLLTTLAQIFGVLPIIVIPITLALEVGMASVFLDGYRGKEINSDQLFKGFKGFSRFAGGMAWRKLWLIIWGLISAVGVLIGVLCVGLGSISGLLSIFMRSAYYYGYSGYSSRSGAGMVVLCVLIIIIVVIPGLIIKISKTYSYRFVPYILLNDSDISATEALRVSMRLTNGYKGKMFLADLILAVAYFVLELIFALLATIGSFFVVLDIILSIVLFIVYYLASGILKAAFYDEIEKEKK